MSRCLQFCSLLILFSLASLFAQTDTWMTHYVTLDDANNGTGYQTSSVAVIEPNRFVALVTEDPIAPTEPFLFNVDGNYLVGYWDADSVNGRIPAPDVTGTPFTPAYGVSGQFTSWVSGFDAVTLKGAWQIAAGGPNNYIYVANNDDNHNILVFELTPLGVLGTDYRMETGTENIFAIEVDDNGYVYVADFKGDDIKTNEVRVYAPIGSPGTSWGDFGGHNDAPTTVIDLPAGQFMGLTVSGDGSNLYVSQSDDYRIWRFTGDPVNGYALDSGFERQLTEADTVRNGSGLGQRVTYLGLAYLNDPPSLYAAVDSFLFIGTSGGYPYGRLHRIHPTYGWVMDSVDIAAWNFARNGSFTDASSDGRTGGYTSVCDVDIEELEQAAYTQTYFGWAVEKWVFDGLLVGVEPVSNVTPESFVLEQNYPNPFNPQTTIPFALQENSTVTLTIYDMLGRKIATLINNERMAPGSYRAIFNGASLPSGQYVYELKAGSFKSSKMMVLTK